MGKIEREEYLNWVIVILHKSKKLCQSSYIKSVIMCLIYENAGTHIFFLYEKNILQFLPGCSVNYWMNNTAAEQWSNFSQYLMNVWSFFLFLLEK